ncbi:glycosyltransferase family protein [Legionella quinlivanii]|uniref:glycosyltransferase family 39 protein n=1 Tax=Legionella quinlivanii TaxID=45073 RepID=UPI00224447BD|nr:glycosyltransferase family 39 protein [Legionella quinlivanii]MCW8450396.1 glycosyltransferase family 39 protein [Legionella quinlivanii]
MNRTQRALLSSLIASGLFLTTLGKIDNIKLAILVHLFIFLLGGLIVYALCLFDFPKKIFAKIGSFLGKSADIPEYQLLGISAVVLFSICYFLSGALFNHLPVEMDSMAQYAGAKIFLSGHWSLASHPLREFFDTPWFINDGRFYTFYPPGHMFLLALGHYFYQPAIINPLIAAVTLIASYYLAKEIGGSFAARICLFLFMVSPFIVFLSSEFDNRSTALLAATLFALFYIRTIKTKEIRNAIFAGLSLGYYLITRPQSALFFSLPFVVYSLWILLFQFRKYFKSFALMSLIILAFIFFFLYYNQQTTGSAFLTGYQKYFGNQVVPGEELLTNDNLNNWKNQIIRVIDYMQLLHRQLFGWPISSLLLAFLLFFLGLEKPWCRLLAMSFFSIYFSLILSEYTYDIFGPRYLYETASIVIILNAIFLSRIPAFFRKRLRVKLSLNEWRGIIALLLFIMTLIALSTIIPARYQLYSNNYRQSNKQLLRIIDTETVKPAVVLLSEENDRLATIFMQPWFDSNPVIVAQDRGSENYKILQYYPERSVYVLEKGKLKRIQ